MNVKHYFEEAYQTLKEHKLRNILTGFGIMWGVFSLVVLIGLGSGFKNGVYRSFKGLAKNNMKIWGGNYKNGQRIVFQKNIPEILKDKFNSIVLIGEESVPHRCSKVSFGKNYLTNILLFGIGKDYFRSFNVTVDKIGRYFNKFDINQNKRVCIIGDKIKIKLFENANIKKKDIIGKYLNIDGLAFKIIGFLEKGTNSNQYNRNHILIPNELFFRIFNPKPEYQVLSVLIKNDINTDLEQKKIIDFLKKKMKIHKSESNAISGWNFSKNIKRIDNLFFSINIFLWIISLSLLLSGAVGVGNMMLVVIKERTKEIGIRKVVGATPEDILIMLIIESVSITLISGFLGMLLGLLSIKGGNIILDLIDKEKSIMLKNMQFDFLSSLVAIIILIIAGAVSGYIPAKKIINMKPIDALSSDR